MKKIKDTGLGKWLKNTNAYMFNGYVYANNGF